MLGTFFFDLHTVHNASLPLSDPQSPTRKAESTAVGASSTSHARLFHRVRGSSRGHILALLPGGGSNIRRYLRSRRRALLGLRGGL
jgi:hypothetical protein